MIYTCFIDKNLKIWAIICYSFEEQTMLFRWFLIIATLLSNAFDKTKKTERSNLKSKNSKQAKKKWTTKTQKQQQTKNNKKAKQKQI